MYLIARLFIKLHIRFPPESKRKLDDWMWRDVKKTITIPAAPNDDPLSAPLVDIGKESSLDDYDEVL